MPKNKNTMSCAQTNNYKDNNTMTIAPFQYEAAHREPLPVDEQHDDMRRAGSR